MPGGADAIAHAFYATGRSLFTQSWKSSHAHFVIVVVEVTVILVLRCFPLLFSISSFKHSFLYQPFS